MLSLSFHRAYFIFSFCDIFASVTSRLQYKRPHRGIGGQNDPTSVLPWEVVTEALQRRDGINKKQPQCHPGTVCDMWFWNAKINIKITHGHPNFTP